MITHHAVSQNLNSGESLKLTHCSAKELLFIVTEYEVAIDDTAHDVEVPCATASSDETSRFAHELRKQVKERVSMIKGLSLY